MSDESPNGADPEFLQPTTVIESDHPAVIAFAEEHIQGASSVREQAVQLYYAVRDGVRYDPFGMTFERDNYMASLTLRTRHAYCIPKAILLAAAARAVGIPSSLGFGDVVNHLASEKLLRLIESNVFYWHGNTNLFIDGSWVKATPAFNIEMCTRFNVKPLEFDGVNDSLLHPYDTDNNRHMEYIGDRGNFTDFPAERIFADFRQYYPGFARLVDEGRLQEALKQPQPVPAG